MQISVLKILVILSVVSLISFLGLLVYERKLSSKGIEEGCEIVFTAETSPGIKITNAAKFKKFTDEYLKCNNGFFAVGDPYSKVGPYNVERVELSVMDGQLLNTYREFNGIPSQGLIHSWDFLFNSLRGVEVVISFGSNLEIYGDPDRLIPYFIASRLSELQNYKDWNERFYRKVSYDNFQTTLKDAGLSYE